MIKLKRIYDACEEEDGFRILVDRLWPRGVSKEKAHLDLWLKDIAPSTELRKWFGHDPGKWEGFVTKYTQEIAKQKELLHQIKKLEEEHQMVTLLYGAKDIQHNEAVVLHNLLTSK